MLRLEGIELRTIQVRRLQSNAFVEGLHRTLREEYRQISGRTKWCETIEEMQKDLDTYLAQYNIKRLY